MTACSLSLEESECERLVAAVAGSGQNSSRDDRIREGVVEEWKLPRSRGPDSRGAVLKERQDLWSANRMTQASRS